MRFVRRVLAPASLLLCLAACASSGERQAGDGGAGGGSSTFAATTTATGDPACDAQGLPCGDDVDPGCQGCALSNACAAAADGCVAEPHGDCVALNDCYLACPSAEDACFEACDAQFPAGVGPLESLLLCIFCGSCQTSCNIDPAVCPG